MITADGMGRRPIFAAFFFAVFLFLLFQLYRLFQGFLAPIAWAILLAIVFFPLQVRLASLLRGRDGLASFLLTTSVIGLVIVPTILLIVVLANESVQLYESVVQFVSRGGLEELGSRLRESWAGRKWVELAPLDLVPGLEFNSLGIKAANAVSGFLVGQATGIAKNILGFVVDFFLCTFALFFLFRDGRRMTEWVRSTLPMEAQHTDLILSRFSDALSAVVQGSLLTAAAQGFLAGLGYWVLGVPFAIFLGCATAFISLIPMGTPIAWGSVAIYLFVSGEWGRGVAQLLWGTLAISTVDNVIRPLFIGGRTNIPTIFLFFGILGGLRAYGFLGVFLAPAVMAMLVAFVGIFREEYTALRAE